MTRVDTERLRRNQVMLMKAMRGMVNLIRELDPHDKRIYTETAIQNITHLLEQVERDTAASGD